MTIGSVHSFAQTVARTGLRALARTIFTLGLMGSSVALAQAEISTLLGASRAAIEATRAPTGSEEGWTRYGPELLVHYEADRATRVRARIVARTCREAAERAGYPQRPGTAPLRRRDGCLWPGISERHRLRAGIAASYRNGVFEVWFR
ncbi:MAG: hypothetical protein AAGE52_27470 [Myxococcota bacterium]